jgi:hypothetical protein
VVINAIEPRHVVTVDIEGAFLNAVMDREVIVEVQGRWCQYNRTNTMSMKTMKGKASYT